MPDEPLNTAEEIRQAMAGSAFHTWMGMRVVEVGDGTVVLALQTADHHRNLAGSIHGGVIATLADTAAGLAMRSVLEPGGRHVTIDLALQYLRAARAGTLTAHGSVLRKTRSIGFAQAEVIDEGDELVARAQVTIALSNPVDPG